MKKIIRSNNKVDELVALVAKERGSKKQARYSPETKSRVRSLIKSGVRPKELIAATGIAGSTIFKWGDTKSGNLEGGVRELNIVDEPIDLKAGHPVLLRLKTNHFEVTVYSVVEVGR